MKTRRNLSGIYVRTEKGENVCFEDLSDEEQYALLDSKPDCWKRCLITQLSKVINEIGEAFDILKELD